MAAKAQRTVYLSPYLWAQLDDLIEYYGDNQNEVLTQILNEWFSDNQTAITNTKARIDGLKDRIAAIVKGGKEGKRSQREE